MNVFEVCQCNCGAITIEIEDSSYSTKNVDLLPVKINPRSIKKHVYCCNYCVNNWGLELCGCGSGELFGQCDAGTEECEFPMQSINGRYNHVTAKGAWG